MAAISSQYMSILTYAQWSKLLLVFVFPLRNRSAGSEVSRRMASLQPPQARLALMPYCEYANDLMIIAIPVQRDKAGSAA